MQWSQYLRGAALALCGLGLVACGGSSGGPPVDPLPLTEWTAPEALPLNNNVGGVPALAMAGPQRAVAVWWQAPDVAAAVFDPAAGWSGKREYDTTPGVGMARTRPCLAADAQGRAVAVWVHTDVVTARMRVLAAPFDPASGWGAPQVIEEAQGRVSDACVAMNQAGDAAVLWRDESLSGPRLRLARHAPAAGWGPPETVPQAQPAPGPVYDVYPNRLPYHRPLVAADAPQVAIDAQGTVSAVWIDAAGVLRASRRLAASGWLAAQELASGPVLSVRAAADGGNTTLVVWQSSGGQQPGIWSSRIEAPAIAWLPPQRLDAAGDPLAPLTAEPPHLALAVHPSGHARAAWVEAENNATAINAVASARFVPAQGWAAAEMLPRTSQAARDPALAVDAQGRAIVAWSAPAAAQPVSLGEDRRVHLAQFVPPAAWSVLASPALVDAAVHAPAVALAQDGTAHLLWGAGSCLLGCSGTTYAARTR